MTIDVSALENRAMQARLKVTAWSARVPSRKETQQLSAMHGVAEGVVSTYKSVLWWSPELDKAVSTGRELSATFRDHTLPWEQEGARVFQSVNYIDFARRMADLIDKRQAAVDELVKVYPSQVAEAPLRMRGLYNPADYPSVDVVRSKFQHTIHFAPIATDWRVEGVDAHLDQLRDQHLKQLEITFAQAHEDAWRRLYERVSYMKDKLSNPDAKRWHDSFLDTSLELCRILTELNIAKDANLEAMRRDLEASLTGVTMNDIREDPNVRAEKAAQMDEIMRKMGAWYAPSPAE